MRIFPICITTTMRTSVWAAEFRRMQLGMNSAF